MSRGVGVIDGPLAIQELLRNNQRVDQFIISPARWDVGQLPYPQAKCRQGDEDNARVMKTIHNFGS
ncbi:MAG: hypothetical protein AMJ56_19630 [Anaerolineae bacterium SG8_19]|nr:MAG: hypothetical protein AMJ56_19630 [Anaerolineae bacterium SG8_19]